MFTDIPKLHDNFTGFLFQRRHLIDQFHQTLIAHLTFLEKRYHFDSVDELFDIFLLSLIDWHADDVLDYFESLVNLLLVGLVDVARAYQLSPELAALQVQLHYLFGLGYLRSLRFSQDGLRVDFFCVEKLIDVRLGKLRRLALQVFNVDVRFLAFVAP